MVELTLLKWDFQKRMVGPRAKSPQVVVDSAKLTETHDYLRLPQPGAFGMPVTRTWTPMHRVISDGQYTRLAHETS